MILIDSEKDTLRFSVQQNINLYCSEARELGFGKNDLRRIINNRVDGKSITEIQARLYDYDHHAGWLRRLWYRWFGGIEKQRSLICFYAAQCLLGHQASVQEQVRAYHILLDHAASVKTFPLRAGLVDFLKNVKTIYSRLSPPELMTRLAACPERTLTTKQYSDDLKYLHQLMASYQNALRENQLEFAKEGLVKADTLYEIQLKELFVKIQAFLNHQPTACYADRLEDVYKLLGSYFYFFIRLYSAYALRHPESAERVSSIIEGLRQTLCERLKTIRNSLSEEWLKEWTAFLIPVVHFLSCERALKAYSKIQSGSILVANSEMYPEALDRTVYSFLSIKEKSSLAKTCRYFNRLFSPELTTSAAHQLVLYVVHNNLVAAEKTLKANPKLLLVSSTVIADANYPNWFMSEATPFQAALRMQNVKMARMIAGYFEQLPDGETKKAKQFYAEFPLGRLTTKSPYYLQQRLIQAISASNDADIQVALSCQQNGSDICQALNEFESDFVNHVCKEKHYNPENISSALNCYSLIHSQWTDNQRALFWERVIGWMRSCSPAHYAPAFVERESYHWMAQHFGVMATLLTFNKEARSYWAELNEECKIILNDNNKAGRQDLIRVGLNRP